jgi:cytochrome c biogenesis protein CcmG, thiol:disulfide interchange protein DsbE
MNGRAHCGVPRWSLIAAPLVLGGLVVSMAVGPIADGTATPVLRPPPLTAGRDLLGEHVSLGSMRGAPLVVIFFGSWCGPCHEDAHIFTRLAVRYRPRVRFISVAIGDPPRDVRAFVGRYGWTWPVLRDEEHRWVAAFGPPGVPATFVLDSLGVVTQTLAGPVSEARVAKALAPLLP